MARLTKQIDRWFDVPNDDDHAALHIRRLKPGERAEIDAKANDVMMRAGDDGKFATEIELHGYRRQMLTVEAAVIGIKGFFDTKGKELPCTTANKQKLLQEFDWLWALVDESLAALEEEFAPKAEAAAKN